MRRLSLKSTLFGVDPNNPASGNGEVGNAAQCAFYTDNLFPRNFLFPVFVFAWKSAIKKRPAISNAPGVFICGADEVRTHDL